MRRLGSLFAVGVLALIAVVSESPDVGSSPRQVSVPSSASATDAVEEHIALAMSEDYDVPLETARRWAIAQAPMGDLFEALYVARPELYGGTRIDHAAGTLVVNSTKPAQTELLLADLPEAEGVRVQVVPADHTIDDLQLIATEIHVRMSNRPDVLPVADPSTNDVVVHVPPSAVAAFIGAKAANPSRYSMVRMESAPEGSTVHRQSCSTSLGICDTPLRGGIEIDSHKPAVCSAASVVRSRTTKLPYLLTAGHCLQYNECVYTAANYFTGTWSTGFSNGEEHAIGARRNSLWCGFDDDAGVLTINNPGGWQLPRQSAVLVQSWGGDRPTTRDTWYEINSVGANNEASVPADKYLCITGAVHDTRCMRFVGPNGNFGILEVTDSFGPCDGDSGAPVYANHKGYGIYSGAYGTAQGTKHWRTIWWFDEYPSIQTTCSREGGFTYYMSLSVAMAHLNVELIP